MRRGLVVGCLLLASCEQYKTPAAGTVTEGKVLDAAPMQPMPSFEAFCGTVKSGSCVGPWEGHPGGKSALGDYRFVVVEYPTPKDRQGPSREVMLELRTSQGYSYRLVGREREGQVRSTLRVKEIIDHPDALEVRLVSRLAPRFSYSDYYTSLFVVPRREGLAAVEIALGKIVGDINSGETKGNVGEATWDKKKVSTRGATVADGVWEVAAR